MSDDARTTDDAAAGVAASPVPQLLVYADADSLADAVTSRLLEVVVAAQRERGVASLLITGGRVMGKVLTTLSTSERGADIDWSALDVWWGDERWVPAGTSGAEGRNDVEFDPVIAAVDLDPARVHRMPASGDFATPEEGAAAYAAELAASARVTGDDPLGPDGAPDTVAVPRFDVALLGVGEDGHCASLFPGAPATRVSDRSVVAVHDSPKPPPDRLSLTFPALDAADQVWFVTAGDGKADAVAMTWGGVTGGDGPTAESADAGITVDGSQAPSSRPRGRSATLWLVDKAAASRLPAELVDRATI